MIFLITSILCSVSVGVFFKVLKAKSAVNINLISINYICAILATYFIFQPEIDFATIPYEFILPLSVLLPAVFWILTYAIRHNGIIKTDIAQRISLLIPVICSYWLFNENITFIKVAGIIIGLTSVFFILNKKENRPTQNYIYLILVFLGYGIIDVLFKQIALHVQIPYTTSLFYIFCGSLIFSLIISVYTNLKTKVSFDSQTILYGTILGFLNFLNIYFYLKAHRSFAQNPITVFATMNFGVIILGTLIGRFYFNEKLTVRNIIGLFLALIAISCIVFAQMQNSI